MHVNNSSKLVDFKDRFVGLEFENPITDVNGNIVDEAVIKDLWQELIQKGWQATTDALTGTTELNKSFAGQVVNISTDCAWSSLETAYPPAQTLLEANDLFKNVRDEILVCLANKPLRWLGASMIPGCVNIDNRFKSNKPFYRLVNPFFYFHNVNLAVNAHQTGVSLKIPEAIAAVNELIKVSGLVVALCAHSSINNFEVLPWKEWRMASWRYIGITKYPGMEKLFGIPSRPFTSLADYFGYFWGNVPLMFLTPMRNGTFTQLETKMNWMEFLEGKSSAGTDLYGKPVMVSVEPADINLAFMVQWPHAKLHVVFDPEKISVAEFVKALKNNTLEDYIAPFVANIYVEYRIGATQPVGEELVLPALTLGLVNNLTELQEFTAKYSWNEWKNFTDVASISGSDAKLGEVPVEILSKELVDIARRGLLVRGFGEESYLDKLYERIKIHENPAERDNRILTTQGKEALLNLLTYK